MDFSAEPLVCYYADIHPSNFPIDIHGQLWVIDFAFTGVLPSCFMSYVIVYRNRLPKHLAKTLPLPESPNLRPLARVTYTVRFINDFCMLELAFFCWSFCLR